LVGIQGLVGDGCFHLIIYFESNILSQWAMGSKEIGTAMPHNIIGACYIKGQQVLLSLIEIFIRNTMPTLKQKINKN